MQTEEAQVSQYAFADDVGVFADTAGEDQCVQTACRYCHAADVFSQAVDEHFQSQFGARMTFGSFFFDGTAVVGQTGDTEQAGFFVQHFGNLGNGHVGVFSQETENGRVDIAAAGTHYQTFQRSQAHAGVLRLAVGNGGNGCAVSQVGNNHAQIFFVFTEETGGFIRNVAVAGTVRAVATQAVFFIQFMWNSVGVGMFRHGLVEGGVEYDNVRQAFENGLCSAQTQEVRRVVQRSERNTFFDAGDNFVINEDGFAVQLAAADDTVADGADTAVEIMRFQFFHQGFNGTGMVRFGRKIDFAFFTVEFKGDIGIRQIEFFCQAAQQYFAAVVIQYGTFEGRAAAVQNQD